MIGLGCFELGVVGVTLEFFSNQSGRRLGLRLDRERAVLAFVFFDAKHTPVGKIFIWGFTSLLGFLKPKQDCTNNECPPLAIPPKYPES